jgi:hypothetical protein
LDPDVTLAIGVFPDGTWVRPVVGGVVGEAPDPDPDPDPDGSPATSATVMTRPKKIIVLLEFIIMTEKKI